MLSPSLAPVLTFGLQVDVFLGFHFMGDMLPPVVGLRLWLFRQDGVHVRDPNNGETLCATATRKNGKGSETKNYSQLLK